MSKRNRFFLAVTPAVLFTLALGVAKAQEDASAKVARLATFQNSTGETSFALSLSPNVALTAADSTDILILFDTSASQTGLYRDDALNALDTLLGHLTEQDRVKLVGVDLEAMEMTKEFVAPGSAQLTDGIKKLRQRSPLGSTDMAKALRNVIDNFAPNGTNSRAVVYIGDGMSRANWLANGEFATLMKDLVNRRAPVSSYAIGPQRDMHLLATIANHTGGMMYADSQTTTGDAAGSALADVVKATVIWPTSVSLPKAMSESYPQTMPPLRSDRDTILVGVLDAAGNHQIEIQAEVNGNPITMKWEVASEKSHEDLAFLPQLIDAVRDDKGLSLPTAGSAGLAEAGRVMLAGARDLAKLGGHALASGDLEGADRLAAAALESDPGNVEAASIRSAILGRDKSAGVAERSEEITLRLVADETTGPSGGAGGLLREFEEGEGRFLRMVEDEKSVVSGRIQAEVEAGLDGARNRLGSDAEGAKNDLKMLLELVERTPDLNSDVRAKLRNQISAALRESGRRQDELEHKRALAQENSAAAKQNERLADELARKNEKIKQLMDRFTSLMDEGRYIEAEDKVGSEIAALAPDTPIETQALFNARFKGHVTKMEEHREQRHRKFAETLYLVEMAHIPYPDDLWIVYPDAEVWEELTMKRLKYRSVDLGKDDGEEQRINAALDESTKLEFIETPLSDVIGYLEDKHGIQIELDTRALDVIGIGSDTPITRDLTGVSLRSALRLMLRDLELTYMIQDEVLMITTPEEANANLVTKVYPVGDLVVPVMSMGMGGMMGGGMGGGGGGMGGGGGGGFGGGGGGFGGGGGGRGGGGFGGGFFAVEDELKLGGPDKQPSSKPQQPKVQPSTSATSSVRPALRINPVVKPGATMQEAWNDHFQNNQVDLSAVRQTVRELMSEAKRFHAAENQDAAKKKLAECVVMMQAALRHGQPQPWMYEAMGLAMQASGAPDSEIERAVMSAVDFSENLDDMMIAAIYLSRIGIDSRALSLLREISSANPIRPEPYVEGLRLAKRLEDIDGIKWACGGILSQAWPSEQQPLFEDALATAKATHEQLKKEQLDDQAMKFGAAMAKALERDCRITITWTGDADVDLMVEEPAGTICSFRTPRTTSGGVMLGDTFSRPAGHSVGGYSEQYVCPEGFSGQYRLLLRKIWGDVTGGKVTVTLTTHYGSKVEQVQKQLVELVDKDALVLFELKDGRRAESLKDHMIASAVQKQAIVSRAALTQSLRAYEDSEATRREAVANNRAADDGRLGPRGRRGVGFRPVITLLPDGTNMGASAVVSADRRYVRVTPMPLFSSVGEVNTFTFSGGAPAPSSRTFKHDISSLSLDEAKAVLRDLKPVKFRYDGEPNELYLGFIAEDVPELVAAEGRKGVYPMDFVSVLTKVVQQQQATIDEQQKQMKLLEGRLNDLQKALEAKN